MKSLLTVNLILILLLLSSCQNSVTDEKNFQIPDKEAAAETELSNTELASFRGAVAHIICASINEDEGDYAGSGIVYDEKGLILTNNHVIPNNNEFLLTGSAGCVITLPDPETGIVNDNIYLAEPKVVKDVSQQYDLATLQIYDLVSLKQAKIDPDMPNKFPTIDISNSCSLDELSLKDKIEIYGYPDVGAISGYTINLVVTDGIISSFPGDGTILTNAKINEGNSGGLAIREDGCFVGIPSAGYSGRMESYGYIISTDLIEKYLKAAKNGRILGQWDNESPLNLTQNIFADNEQKYDYPSYITISSAEFIVNNAGKERLELQGNVSSNCTRIDVNVLNRERYIDDDHTLNEWKPGETNFVYRLAPDLGNIGIGYNEITITATCAGGQSPQYTMMLPWGI